MKLYFTLNRSMLFSLLLAVIGTILIYSEISSASIYAQSGATNSARLEYLNSLNCSVYEESVSSKEIVIPSEFSDVYQNYNKIQIEAGFDLTPYKGSEAIVYSYSVIAFSDIKCPAYANIIVCKGKIIGGDISSVAIDGVMLPLLKP